MVLSLGIYRAAAWVLLQCQASRGVLIGVSSTMFSGAAANHGGPASVTMHAPAKKLLPDMVQTKQLMRSHSSDAQAIAHVARCRSLSLGAVPCTPPSPRCRTPCYTQCPQHTLGRPSEVVLCNPRSRQEASK